MANNKFVVGFFNRGDHETEFSVSIKNDLKIITSSYSVRDAIEHKDLGSFSDDTLKATVRKHAIRVFVLTYTKSEEKKHFLRGFFDDINKRIHQYLSE